MDGGDRLEHGARNVGSAIGRGRGVIGGPLDGQDCKIRPSDVGTGLCWLGVEADTEIIPGGKYALLFHDGHKS